MTAPSVSTTSPSASPPESNSPLTQTRRGRRSRTVQTLQVLLQLQHNEENAGQPINLKNLPDVQPGDHPRRHRLRRRSRRGWPQTSTAPQRRTQEIEQIKQVIISKSSIENRCLLLKTPNRAPLAEHRLAHRHRLQHLPRPRRITAIVVLDVVVLGDVVVFSDVVV